MPNTSSHDPVIDSTNPVSGTPTRPASVAAVLPAANTTPAWLGATSKWLTLTAPEGGQHVRPKHTRVGNHNQQRSHLQHVLHRSSSILQQHAQLHTK